MKKSLIVAVCLFSVIGLAVALFKFFTTINPFKFQSDVKLDGDRFFYRGDAYPTGKLEAIITGFRPKLAEGDDLNWQLNATLSAAGLEPYEPKIEQMAVILAAHRMCDEQGFYRDYNAAYYSTYLTPSGLPIEGYQRLINNSHIGGPYKTPLDEVIYLSRGQWSYSRDVLSFSTSVSPRLAEDFPAGMYRIEVGFFALVEDDWLPLQLLPMLLSHAPWTIKAEYVQALKCMSPPITIGRLAGPPRMIWMLFASHGNLGVSGVVAQEDQANFALSNRVKPPARYILPCNPERQKCIYRIAPDLPTVKRKRIVNTKSYQNNLLEPDFSKGEISVRVKRPDGVTDDLGVHRLSRETDTGMAASGEKLNYHFDRYGKYEIFMVGKMIDIFGNSYETGGLYEVWVAIPLTFTTGIKPGTPMPVGSKYSVAATLNPPVPADVEVTLKFYPATHPQDEISTTFYGQAQKYGYFFPQGTPAVQPFPEPGEYRVDIKGTYTDRRGRLYSGQLSNAGVVISDPSNMIIHGMGEDDRQGSRLSQYRLSGSYRGCIRINYPAKSGDTMYFQGNPPDGQEIAIHLAVKEKSGTINSLYHKAFSHSMIRLSRNFQRTSGFFCSPEMNMAWCKYLTQPKSNEYLPLLSITSKGYSPFEFPELVEQRGYFYISTSRPGFPIYFVVGDSTILDNYWSDAYNDYFNTIGIAKRGDQPGDVYWSVVSGLFFDHEGTAAFTGEYGAGGTVLLRGDEKKYNSAPFQEPILRINGVDYDIYAGVGPSPGSMYETGAVKGVGSVAVPMTSHNVEIIIEQPDASRFECRGRADFIGNFSCPNGPMVFEQPGVYRVFGRFWEGEHEGWTPGAMAGWYRVYAVDKHTSYTIQFDRISESIGEKEPLVISGTVTPGMIRGKLYYSLVAPGMLLDEGEATLAGDRFQIKIFPDQFKAQFSNLHDHIDNILNLSSRTMVHPTLNYLGMLFSNSKEKRLAKTIEIVVFAEGIDATGHSVSAGAKAVMRGTQFLIPEL